MIKRPSVIKEQVNENGDVHQYTNLSIVIGAKNSDKEINDCFNFLLYQYQARLLYFVLPLARSYIKNPYGLPADSYIKNISIIAQDNNITVQEIHQGLATLYNYDFIEYPSYVNKIDNEKVGFLKIKNKKVSEWIINSVLDNTTEKEIILKQSEKYNIDFEFGKIYHLPDSHN